ncbi:MAG: hypothetical protein C4320_08325 [Armatimonadota bacterium]
MSTDRLQIALFSDSALPIINGVSTSIATLTDDLRELGHSVTLFAPRYHKKTDADPNTYRFPSFESPFNRGYPCARWPYYPMLKHFRNKGFDIVHLHTPFVLGMVGLRWAESFEIPVVATYHTLYDRYAHYIPVFPRRYVRFRLAKHTNFVYNSVSHVVVPTDAALRWLRRSAASRHDHPDRNPSPSDADSNPSSGRPGDLSCRSGHALRGTPCPGKKS